MRTITATMLLHLLLAACGPAEAPETAEDPAGDMEGMRGEGMEHVAGEGSDMMERMSAHMRLMDGMSGDSMRLMLATHRPMVANMIASMNGEMAEMNMPADEAWSATVDSLRDDLVAMPEMDAARLEALMPAHRQRVMRLMEMHREMMSAMGM